jgi:tryptophan 2,3-dioxygenase
MTLISADDKRYVDVGSEQIWFSVLYTAEVFLQDMMQEITFARDFLSHKKCSASIALETARQINLLRDAFRRSRPKT